MIPRRFIRGAACSVATMLVAVSTGCDITTTKPGDGLDLPAAGEAAIAWAADPGGDFDIFLLRPDGSSTRRLTDHTGFDGEPAWAPDGTRLVFSSERSGISNLYILDLGNGSTRRLTNSADADVAPSWSPEGDRIAFVSHRDGNAEIYTIGVDGSAVRRLTDHPGVDEHPSWSADGRRLLFTSDRNGSLDVFAMDAATGDAAVELVLGGAAEEGHAVWSPDGERIAYVSDVSGDHEVYIQTVATPDETPVNVSFNLAADGFGLSWSPDGRHLVFVSRRNGNFEIYTLETPGRELTELPESGTLTWSANGRRAAILPPEGGALLAADTTGAMAWTLMESVLPGSPTWSADAEWITFTSTADGGNDVYVANALGTQTAKVHAGLTDGGDPSWSPDGRRLVFAADVSGDEQIYIARLSVDSLDQVNVDTVATASGVSRALWPRWSPGEDRIAYLSEAGGEGLYFTRLDSSGLAFLGTPAAGPFDVGPIDAVTDISWAPQGTRIYVLSDTEGASALTIVDGVDLSTRRWTDYPIVGEPVWGNEDLLLFVSDRTGDNEVYRIDLPDGEPQNLSNHPGSDTSPDYSPAMGAVIFISDRSGLGDIYGVQVAVDNTDLAVARLTGKEAAMGSLHWGSAAGRMYFTAASDGAIRLLEHGLRRLTSSTARDWYPAWSPAASGN